MEIKLNVSEETFKSYLIKIGYSYKINQYPDFIAAIKRMTLSHIRKSVIEDNTKIVLERIFDKNKKISLYVLSDEEDLNSISSKYLKKLIENSRLDLFLEEGREITFKKEIQELAYKKELLSNLKKENENSETFTYLSRSLLETDYIEDKIKKCIGINGILLSEEEKEKIDIKFQKYFLRYISSFEQLSKYESIVDVLYLNNIFIKVTYPENKMMDYIYNKIKDTIDIKKNKIYDFKINVNEKQFDKINSLAGKNNILTKFIRYIIQDSTNAFLKTMILIIDTEYSYIRRENIKKTEYFEYKRDEFVKRIKESKEEFEIYKTIDLFLLIFDKTDFPNINNETRNLFHTFEYIKRIANEINNIDEITEDETFINLKYGNEVDIDISFKEVKEYINNI